MVTVFWFFWSYSVSGFGFKGTVFYVLGCGVQGYNVPGFHFLGYNVYGFGV